jgi:hypothetical protein
MARIRPKIESVAVLWRWQKAQNHDELKAQGFNGNISIEYETLPENTLPDVVQCVGFFRGYASCK